MFRTVLRVIQIKSHLEVLQLHACLSPKISMLQRAASGAVAAASAEAGKAHKLGAFMYATPKMFDNMYRTIELYPSDVIVNLETTTTVGPSIESRAEKCVF